MAKPQTQDSEAIQAINDLGSTVKVLDDRYRILRKKIKVTDSNLLDTERSLNKELQILNDDLLELKSKITTLTEKLGQAFQDSQNLVKRHEFLELKKYVELWEPLQFMKLK